MIPYGVYWRSGVAWLVQETDSVNAIGLAEPCPFRRPVRPGCPHDISLPVGRPDSALLDQLELLRRDPLARLMFPLPLSIFDMQPLKFFFEGFRTCVYLQNLWSPSPSGELARFSFMNSFNIGMHRAADNMTNISPIVYKGCTFENQSKLTWLMKYRHRNRCIVFGDRNVVLPVDQIEVVESTPLAVEDLIKMDLNAVGALALRNYMRGDYGQHCETW
jgi:hypothetical protein